MAATDPYVCSCGHPLEDHLPSDEGCWECECEAYDGPVFSILDDAERGAQGARDDGSVDTLGGSNPGSEARTTDQADTSSNPRSTFGTGPPIGTAEPVRLPGSTPKRASLGCRTCDDDGYFDITDPETGGVVGPRPCPDCGGR